MSDAMNLARIIVVFGILFVFVGLLYPGQDAAWVSFRNTITLGPQLPAPPTDPYAAQTRSFTLTVIQNGTIEPVTSSVTPPGDSPVNDCYNTVTPENTQWYNCVTDANGNRTSVNLNSAGGNSCHGIPWCSPGYAFSMNLSSIPPDVPASLYAIRVNVAFECQRLILAYTGMVAFDFWRAGDSLSTDPVFAVAWLPGHENPFNSTYGCPIGDTYPNPSNFTTLHASNSFTLDFGVNAEIRVGNFSNAQMIVRLQDSGVVEFSYFLVTIDYLFARYDRSVDCGWDIGCVLGQFFSWVADFLTFVVSNAIYFVQTLIAYIIFVFTAMGTFLFGLFTAISFFFAIPGLPGVAQALISAIFLGVLAFMTYVIIGLVRGSGPG